MIILFLRHIFWVHGKRMIAFHSALSSSQITATTHSQYCTQELGTSSQNRGLLRGDGFNIQFRKVVSKHLRLVYILLASLKHRVLGLGGHWKGRGISPRKSQRGSSRAKGFADPMSSSKASIPGLLLGDFLPHSLTLLCFQCLIPWWAPRWGGKDVSVIQSVLHKYHSLLICGTVGFYYLSGQMWNLWVCIIRGQLS